MSDKPRARFLPFRAPMSLRMIIKPHTIKSSLTGIPTTLVRRPGTGGPGLVSLGLAVPFGLTHFVAFDRTRTRILRDLWAHDVRLLKIELVLVSDVEKGRCV